MSYFKDLSCYSYHQPIDLIKEDAINIGWLDINHDYTKGEVTKEFIDSLWQYILYPIKTCRGLHECNLCKQREKYTYVIYEGYEIALGDSEIRVMSEDGKKIYAAPNLILHYILKHNYKPPNHFIEAVLYGPKPDTKTYREMVVNLYMEAKLEKKFLTYKSYVCPNCNGGRLYFGFKQKKNVDDMKEMQMGEKPYDDMGIIKRLDESEYIFNIICRDCGIKFSKELERTDG